MAFLDFLIWARGDSDKIPLVALDERDVRTLRRWIFTGLALGVMAFFPAWNTARAEEGSSKEYQVKAAFLFNFIQFVKWPPGAFSSPDAPLSIGILGDDPFEGALGDVVHGETVEGHRLTVLRSHDLASLQGCQLIFVARSEEGRMEQILASVGSRPILTVSEIDRFAENGGDINFYLVNGRVRFEINPSSARHGGLKISSQLLNLGRIVGGGE